MVVGNLGIAINGMPIVEISSGNFVYLHPDNFLKSKGQILECIRRWQGRGSTKKDIVNFILNQAENNLMAIEVLAEEGLL